MHSFSLKALVSWATIREHLCTLAVAVSLNSTWRVPRETYRYGGVSYLLVLTVAMVTVALPATLLQLVVGQFSQQDAVGVWRAVPFFKGVGYIRLVVSYLASIYSIIYVALVALIYLLFTVNNSIPLWECPEAITSSEVKNVSNEIKCLNSTFLAPIGEQPEYYLALSMLTVVLWIIFPFIFYNPIKLMKRILYVLGPLVLLLIIVTATCISSQSNLVTLQSDHDWNHYLDAKIWYSAVTQALLSSQIAGGFLISSGTAIYSSTNVQRTTWVIIGANVVCSWLGVVFWFSVTGAPLDTSVLSVLVQMFRAAEEQGLENIWPMVVYAMLFSSGLISMLVLLYPMYDHFRRVGGQGWRIMSFTSSFIGATAALALLVGGVPVLTVLEDTAIPFLVSVSTVLEIIAFIFIYGWKPLLEDVEFLTGRKLRKVWVLSWSAAPAIVVAFTAWWLAALFLDQEGWMEPPWQAVTVVVTALVAIVMFLGLAVASVVKQVQYDLIGKIKSSFTPSRHWGPRDPITYYYWMARRQDHLAANEIDNLPTRYSWPQLGQMTTRTGFLNISQHKQDLEKNT